jgi:NADPH:quinone reductase-like Zn-dependent oxidoreductase
LTFLSGYKLMRLLPNSLFGRIAESDFAGEIVNPNGCERFKIGDQVFGAISSRVSLRTRQGALAQYVFGPAETIVHRPESIPVNEASGIPVVAVTAHQALFDIGKLQPGQKVFINGGSTSVGIYAIQFAKAIGCEVHASASGKNEDFLKNLGVDKVPRCYALFSHSPR